MMDIVREQSGTDLNSINIEMVSLREFHPFCAIRNAVEKSTVHPGVTDGSLNSPQAMAKLT
jgi:hypothetical protein